MREYRHSMSHDLVIFIAPLFLHYDRLIEIDVGDWKRLADERK